MKEPSSRLLSLDVFRGITIAFMILVNSPGNDTAYVPLDHSEWNGLTPTDLVFPFFVFIVGVSLVFSFRRRLERGDTRAALMRQAAKRTLIILGLGLFLNAFPFTAERLAMIRIPGVLQRIGVCYLIAASLYKVLAAKSRETQRSILGAVAGVLLVGYWLWMTKVPNPAGVAGPTEPAISASDDERCRTSRAIRTPAALISATRSSAP